MVSADPGTHCLGLGCLARKLQALVSTAVLGLQMDATPFDFHVEYWGSEFWLSSLHSKCFTD